MTGLGMRECSVHSHLAVLTQHDLGDNTDWYLCLDSPALPTNQISITQAHMAKRPSVPLNFIHSEVVCRKPKQKRAVWLAKTIWHIARTLKVNLSEIWAPKIWGVEF
jgi:hypothetical protein